MYYLIIFYVGRHCAQVQRTVLMFSALSSNSVYCTHGLCSRTVLNGYKHYLWITKHKSIINLLRTTILLRSTNVSLSGTTAALSGTGVIWIHHPLCIHNYIVYH